MVAAAAGAVSPACPVLPFRNGGINRSQQLWGVLVHVLAFSVPLPGAWVRAGRYQAGP